MNSEELVNLTINFLDGRILETVLASRDDMATDETFVEVKFPKEDKVYAYPIATVSRIKVERL
jgi:hypothetical protein